MRPIPDRLWLGAAGGGVWKSEDGGRTWRALWHAQPVLNIGALAIDPANPAILYAGTGEANLSADSYPGVGIYKTTNGGRTWRRLASVSAKKLPRRIGVIAIDPFDSRHIRIGGVSHSAGDVDGMHVTVDGGRLWQRATFLSTNPHRCHAIVFHPTQRGTIFATFTGAGILGGIWRTTDGGATWTQLTSGLPSPAAIGRTSLAIAPSDPRVIYALSSDTSDGVLGVFRSRNGGNSWTNVAGAHFADEGQMFYGNTIVVHPTNPLHVLCGGVDLHLTTNGGTSWRRATEWDADRGRPEYAHADHHALVMPAARPGLVYDANDGGLDASLDGGARWENRSNGLATNMFYDLDVAQSDGRIFGGGAQDNGTLVTEQRRGQSVCRNPRRRRRLDRLRPGGRAPSLRLVAVGQPRSLASRPAAAGRLATDAGLRAFQRVDGDHDVRPEQRAARLHGHHAHLAHDERRHLLAGRLAASRRQPDLGHRDRPGQFATRLCRHGKRRLFPQSRRRLDVERATSPAPRCRASASRASKAHPPMPAFSSSRSPTSGAPTSIAQTTAA